MAKIILKKNEERRIKQGHLWIFSNEIHKTSNGPEGDDSKIPNGELVDVYDSKNSFMGKGFYNFNSLIAVRMFSSRADFDFASLLEERLTQAYNLRKFVYPNRDSFRIVFSESDFIPGLIIDKYNNTFVLQISSAVIENNVNFIVDALLNKFGAENIFTKNEYYFRKLEGLTEEDKVYAGEMKIEIISDGFVKYNVDFANAHKTGFYFDQCDNREFFGSFCSGKSVLDCFCNSGGFGLHAALNGAEHITFVDSSKVEISNAEKNFALNKFQNNSEFIDEDVFDYLEKQIAVKRKFDIVNIDPPAFAKSKKNLPQAIKGYEKLNRLAIEITKEGGLVFTSSCSHHLKEEMFLDLIRSAAIKAGRKIQIIYFNNASKDHPFLPAMDETIYLKFAAVRVLGN